MNLLVEEMIVFLLVLISVPALIYAFQKLTGRKVNHKLVILLIYVVIFYVCFELIEMLMKSS